MSFAIGIIPFTENCSNKKDQMIVVFNEGGALGVWDQCKYILGDKRESSPLSRGSMVIESKMKQSKKQAL